MSIQVTFCKKFSDAETDREYLIAKLALEDANHCYLKSLAKFTEIKSKRKKNKIKKPFIILLDYLKEKLH